MGVIQSSINNLLATATIAAKLSPGIEAIGDARRAARKAEQAEEVEKKTFNADNANPVDIQEAQDAAKKAVGEAADKAKAAYEANPTAKRFEAMQSAEYKFANRLQNEEDIMREKIEAAEENRTAKAQKQFDLDTKMAQISKKAETALKWETERVRNSTNFRTYQETLPVKKNNAENRQKEKSGYFEELKVGGNI